MSGSQNVSNTSEAPQYSLRTLLIAVLVVSLCLGVVAFFRIRAGRWQAELDRLAKIDKVTMEEIVKDVEAIRTRLGRAPKDQSEVEALLGKRMPVVHDHGYPTPVYYFRKSDNRFYLHYELLDTDDWIYDSDIPKAGCVQHWN